MTMLNDSNQPKKLAIVLTLPSLGGLELNLLKYAAYRSKNNLATFLVLSAKSAAIEWAKKENLQYKVIGNPTKYFSLIQIVQLRQFVQQNSISDILCSSSQDLDLVAWTKFSLQNNALKIHFYQQMQLGVSKKDFYHTWKFSIITNWFAPLPWLKQEVLKKTNVEEKKISIVPLCLDSMTFLKDLKKFSKTELKKNHNLNEDSIVLGIVGRIDPGKGQLTVVKAFIQNASKHTKLHLCIIGSPTINDKQAQNYDKFINDEINGCSYQERITRITHVHNSAYIYPMLDILVVASQKETFGMVTVEGLLANLIVLGAHSGGTSDILGQGEHGILFEVNSEIDLAKKIDDVLTNFETYKHKNENKDFSKEYDFARLNSYLGI